MIVSLPQLLVAVVLLAFLWISIDWMFGRLAERRRARDQRRTVRECHLCGKSYQEKKRVKLSTCPECAARNVRGGHRKLG
jgi:uncharacterized paraquat-inducible protein A